MQVNLLSHCEAVCGQTEVANALINAPLFGLLVRLLTVATPTLQLHLATLLGLLVRHATCITGDSCSSGLPLICCWTIFLPCRCRTPPPA